MLADGPLRPIRLLDAASCAGVDNRKRFRRRRVGIGGRLVRREVDVALEVRRNRDELAEVVDRELARVVSGIGAGRSGEVYPRCQHGRGGDHRPSQHGDTLRRARGRGDCILDRDNTGRIETTAQHTDPCIQTPQDALLARVRDELPCDDRPPELLSDRVDGRGQALWCAALGMAVETLTLGLVAERRIPRRAENQAVPPFVDAARRHADHLVVPQRGCTAARPLPQTLSRWARAVATDTSRKRPGAARGRPPWRTSG